MSLPKLFNLITKGSRDRERRIQFDKLAKVNNLIITLPENEANKTASPDHLERVPIVAAGIYRNLPPHTEIQQSDAHLNESNNERTYEPRLMERR